MDMKEKTCNEFLKEMAAAGFSYDFIATNGDNEIKGNCKDGVIKIMRNPDKNSVIKKLEMNRIKNDN
jgi:hypothetical protein